MLLQEERIKKIFFQSFFNRLAKEIREGLESALEQSTVSMQNWKQDRLL